MTKKHFKTLMALACVFCLTLAGAFASYAHGWEHDSNHDTWRCQDENGAYRSSCWYQHTDDCWYHFDESGYMQKNCWITGADNRQYYLTDTGAMLCDGTTPDGCRVDKTGARINADGSYYCADGVCYGDAPAKSSAYDNAHNLNGGHHRDSHH